MRNAANTPLKSEVASAWNSLTSERSLVQMSLHASLQFLLDSICYITLTTVTIALQVLKTSCGCLNFPQSC